MLKLCRCGCGKAARKGGTLSAACYQREYRKTASGSKAVKAAQRKCQKQRAENGKDAAYHRQWRERTHFYVPAELRALRRAVKRLEKVLAYTDERRRIRESGEQAGDDGPERPCRP